MEVDTAAVFEHFVAGTAGFVYARRTFVKVVPAAGSCHSVHILHLPRVAFYYTASP